MSIKQSCDQCSAWIKKHPVVVTLVAVVLLAGSAFVIFEESTPPTPVVPIFNAYFYDLENGNIFVARMNEPSPILAPGAPPGATPTGVKANVFACHSCEDEKDRFVAFVESYTPEAKARMIALSHATSRPTTSPGFEELERGHLVARPDPKNPDWKNQFVEYMSPEGTKLMNSAQRKCGDGVSPKICMPDQDHFR